VNRSNDTTGLDFLSDLNGNDTTGLDFLSDLNGQNTHNEKRNP